MSTAGDSRTASFISKRYPVSITAHKIRSFLEKNTDPQISLKIYSEYRRHGVQLCLRVMRYQMAGEIFPAARDIIPSHCPSKCCSLPHKDAAITAYCRRKYLTSQNQLRTLSAIKQTHRVMGVPYLVSRRCYSL